MIKSNERGYKGKVYFLKNIKFGFTGPVTLEDRDDVPEGHVYLGECDVDVDFVDSRMEEIETREKNLQKKRADFHMEEQQEIQIIQELRCLNHDKTDDKEDDCPPL